MNRLSPSWSRRRVPLGRGNRPNRGVRFKYVLSLVPLFLILLFYFNVHLVQKAFSYGKASLESDVGTVIVDKATVDVDVVVDEVPASSEEAQNDVTIIRKEEESEVYETIENSNEEEVDIVDIQDDRNRHVVFIMIGAVRAIEKTAFVTIQNLVSPLCSPVNCTAHLVTHLSYSDNRPDEGKHDPRGISITLEDAEIQRIQSFIHTTFCSTERTNDESPTVNFKDCHEVSPAYNIGSSEEQAAMDTFESDCCNEDPVLRNRLRSLRYGDPRRYSMWFARNHAWRFVESTFDTWALNANNTQFMFIRPDLLWYLPFAPYEYIQSRTTHDNQIWIHDSYYANIPDTWAFLPNFHVAKSYFSILDIVHEGVGCLGGPDFDRSLAEERLKDMGILQSSESNGENRVLKWCTDNDPSWSEEILLSKLRRLHIQHRFMPAGVSLLRKDRIDCQPIHPNFKLDGDENHAPTFVPVLKCFMTSRHFFHEQGENMLERINGIEIFRIRATWNDTVCIAQLDDHGTLGMQRCQEHPTIQAQLFAHSSHANGLFTLWDRDVFLNVSSSTDILQPWVSWRKDFIEPFDQVKSLELRGDNR